MSTDTRALRNSTLTWGVNPFEVIAPIWKDVVELAKVGVPHVVGTIKVNHGVVVGLQLSIAAYPEEVSLTFRDEDGLHIILPVEPMDGPEGVYLKLLQALGARA